MIQVDTRNALVFFDLCMPQRRETGSNQKRIHLIRERMCQVATTGPFLADLSAFTPTFGVMQSGNGGPTGPAVRASGSAE
jgi:hypothetical protein